MKTLILKWNPAISDVSMDDMYYQMMDAVDDVYDEGQWSVHDWEKAERGDRFFLLRVGRGKVGIIGSGWLTSGTFADEDWDGSSDTVHYARMIYDVFAFPKGNNILETRTLRKEIPDVDWKGGHSGVYITDEQASVLETLWMNYQRENTDQFYGDRHSAFLSMLNRAYGIALSAHKGQVDKAGNDYIKSHIMDVHYKCQLMFDEIEENPEIELVALLHDVVEDTDWTLDKLKDWGFSHKVIEALDCVTKREGEDYDHFIERIKPNPIARAVKIADLQSNMTITRLNEITDVDVERLRKYLKAYKELVSVTAND